MIWIIADEREIVVALARPFIEAALDVGGSADFEEDGFLRYIGSIW